MAAMKRRSDYISVLLSLCSLCAHQLVSDCMHAHTAVCNYIFIDVCSHVYLFLQDVCLPLCFSVCACRCALTNGELNGDGWDVKTLLPPLPTTKLICSQMHTQTHILYNHLIINLWACGLMVLLSQICWFLFFPFFPLSSLMSLILLFSIRVCCSSWCLWKKNTRFLCFHFCVLVLNTFSSLPVHCPFINYLVCK